MGAKSSVQTKNTFINIDTRGFDAETMMDPRLIKSWHPSNPPAVNSFGAENDVDNGETEVHEAVTPKLCRIKTLDLLEDDGSASEASTPSDVPSAAASQKDGEDDAEDCCRTGGARDIQASVPSPVAAPNPAQPSGYASPYLAAQVPADSESLARTMLMHMVGNNHAAGTPSQGTVMWAWSPPFAPVQPQRDPTKEAAFAELQLPDTHPCPVEEAKEQEPEENSEEALWTCRMVRNLPNDYSRRDLVALLDSYQIQFNFIYLPIDWTKRANLGYAFVNLETHKEAKRLDHVLTGFSDWIFASEKVCEVVWGRADQQDLGANIERFRNSPVMHPDVPEQFKPLLFKNGRRVVFPAPTRKLQPPRGFRR